MLGGMETYMPIQQDLITSIASRKMTKGAFILRNLVNKGLNKAISKTLKLKNSIVLYKGISLLDNETPIMVVMSGYNKDSENDKTGPLVQLYILPIDILPRDAYTSGSKSVCGDCRYNGDNGCYVRWSHLKGMWNSARSQNPIPLSLAKEFVKGLRVRVGAAGDPAAVPFSFWNELLSSCESHTGYTHQWNKPQFASLSRLFVASTDSKEETKQANAKGWPEGQRGRCHELRRVPPLFMAPLTRQALTLMYIGDATHGLHRHAEFVKRLKKGRPIHGGVEVGTAVLLDGYHA